MGFWKSLVGQQPQPSSEPSAFQQAKQEYLDTNPQVAEMLSACNADLAPSALPDDTPLVTVVNGTWVNTVGEYKAALPDNNYT